MNTSGTDELKKQISILLGDLIDCQRYAKRDGLHALDVIARRKSFVTEDLQLKKFMGDVILCRLQGMTEEAAKKYLHKSIREVEGNLYKRLMYDLALKGFFCDFLHQSEEEFQQQLMSRVPKLYRPVLRKEISEREVFMQEVPYGRTETEKRESEEHYIVSRKKIDATLSQCEQAYSSLTAYRVQKAINRLTDDALWNEMRFMKDSDVETVMICMPFPVRKRMYLNLSIKRRDRVLAELSAHCLFPFLFPGPDEMETYLKSVLNIL